MKKKIKRGHSVNYFANLRSECHFLKLECNEFSFPKRRGCQCNLPFFNLKNSKIEMTSFLGHLTKIR